MAWMYVRIYRTAGQDLSIRHGLLINNKGFSEVLLKNLNEKRIYVNYRGNFKALVK